MLVAIHCIHLIRFGNGYLVLTGSTCKIVLKTYRSTLASPTIGQKLCELLQPLAGYSPCFTQVPSTGIKLRFSSGEFWSHASVAMKSLGAPVPGWSGYVSDLSEPAGQRLLWMDAKTPLFDRPSCNLLISSIP